jgi:DNA (cytosine-5)-methyltransferase 1
MRRRLLDLFCGAGGIARGYADVGFEVVGVDIRPQPNYPYEFHLADALDFPLWGFDAVHASPPCQYSSSLASTWNADLDTANLIRPTRDRLIASGLPFVIENVPGAFLRQPITLCGSTFGLRVRRHRIFETNWPLPEPDCDHGWQDADRIYPQRISKARGEIRWTGVMQVHGTRQLHNAHCSSADEHRLACEAMGIDWMTRDELTQAIPPAFGRYIGERLLAMLGVEVAPQMSLFG